MATAWDDIILITDEDVKKYESELTDGLTIDIGAVKEHLEIDLHNRFEHTQRRCEQYYDDDDFEVLDHIENPDELKRPAIYFALYFIFSQQSLGNDNDIYSQKAKFYLAEYNKALNYACNRLRWDTKITDIITNQGKVELVW